MFAVADVAFADTDHVKKTDIEWPVGNGNSRIYFDTETGTITGCSRYVQKVEIPEEINGKRVKKIGRDAFFNCIRLEEIVIPNSIESIGDCAFGNCALTEITIPESVKEIGHNPFTICKNLESINVSPDNVYYRSISGVLYDRDVTTVIRCPQKTKQVSIPYGVTDIDRHAFSGCTALSKISIPSSVKTIGSWAFKGCEALSEITIPDSVKEIGRDSFMRCRI